MCTRQACNYKTIGIVIAQLSSDTPFSWSHIYIKNYTNQWHLTGAHGKKKKRGSQTRQDFHTCSRSLKACFNYIPFTDFTRQWFKRREFPKKVNKIIFPTHFIRLKMHGVLPLSQGSRFYTAIQYFNVSLPSCSVYNINMYQYTYIIKDVQNLSTLERITSSIHLEKCLHSENTEILQVEKGMTTNYPYC